MSDIGVFLLLFVGVLLLVGVIRFLAWLTELQEAHGSLGQAGVNAIKRYVVVTRPMSSERGDRESDQPTVSPAVTTFTTAEQPIVTPNNEYNGGVVRQREDRL